MIIPLREPLTLLAGLQTVLEAHWDPLSQPEAKNPNLKDPIRNLSIGSLNLLHTTDTHGWYMGHMNQRQYSADWGDLISFETHLREGIEAQNGDLLLVDTGDRHDGNGLSDLTAINGQFSNDIFMQLPYDLVTVGNHELYKAEISKLEFTTTVPFFGERFVSTNVRYLDDDNQWVVFGNSTHRYFETKVNKYKVFALSFLFDFLWANERVRVEPVAKLVHEPWFQKLLTEYKGKDIDTIVVFGHMPVSHQWKEFGELHSTLRSYFPNTPIQYLGGHSHIRDFSVLDHKSVAIQSGRYCETVGFLSIKDLAGQAENPNVFRSYIDFNRHSFIEHSNTTFDTFDTLKGQSVTNKLTQYASELQLQEIYGRVPHTFYTSAADYSSNDAKSLLRFLETDILSQLEAKSCDATNISHFNNSRIVLINTGSIRYDLYKGDFTKNALFTVSPFKNKWRVIPNVPRSFALQIQKILNNGPVILSANNNLQKISLKSPHQLALDSLRQCRNHDDRRPYSYGLTTVDDFGSDGDDTIHKHFHNYYVPNVIQSLWDQGDTLIDVVYYDFIEPFIFNALRQACSNDEELFQDLVSQAQYYNNCAEDSNVGQLLKKYVIENWSS